MGEVDGGNMGEPGLVQGGGFPSVISLTMYSIFRE